MTNAAALPIDAHLAAIVERVRERGAVVLHAETGSGKTTRVPPALADAYAADRAARVIVLQPRRIATRLAAARVASERGCSVGEEVGYAVRHDRRVGRSTRVVYMTEGLLRRRLASGDLLDDVGVVVLDEFHERSIDADLVLALLAARRARGEGPAIVVMSATLDAERVGAFLDAPTIKIDGRTHSVSIVHRARGAGEEPWDAAARALDESVLDEGVDDDGDVLVFMPGVHAIDRTIESCRVIAARRGLDLEVLPLHGRLSIDAQQRAVRRATGRDARRRVVVATNVAETSLTIDGVTTVIDAGLARIARFDPVRELDLLRIEPISRASADQRAGRAGRTRPGRCIRLWSETEDRRRPDFDDPEIRRVDLCGVLLDVLAADLAPDSIPWFEPPVAQALDRARRVLEMIGAIAVPTDHDETDARGGHPALSEIGSAIAGLGTHPRLGRALLEAARTGVLERAARCAAIVESPDAFGRGRAPRSSASGDDPRSDLLAREASLDFAESRARTEIERSAAELMRRIGRRERAERTVRSNDGAAVLAAFLAGFPDHVAIKRAEGRPDCAMRGRRDVELARDSIVRAAGPILALEIREDGRDGNRRTWLSLASELPIEIVRRRMPERFGRHDALAWNDEIGAVESREVETFDEQPLSWIARPARPGPRVEAMLAERVVDGSIRLERWDEAVAQWIERVRFVAATFPERELPVYDADDLAILRLELVSGAVRASQVRQREVRPVIEGALEWDDQEFVRKMAPERLPLPGGGSARIVYEAGRPPTIAVRVQQLFGWAETPRIAGGRAPVALEILAPSRRPVQRTSDLAGFWERTYPEVRKELRRRYPKHAWPEHPPSP